MMVKAETLNEVNSPFVDFTSLEKEYSLDNILVEGRIPDWITGSFIRNSVSKFEFEHESYKHWFDGIAMFHSFNFANGNVSYKNRFLQSSDYKKGIKTGKIAIGSFGTNPKHNILEKVKSFFDREENIPNANVNVTSINGEMVAMTEVPAYVKFSLDTLDTEGLVSFEDNLKGQVTTAHPHYDFKRNTFYNTLINFSKTSNYIFYKINANSKSREVVASIPIDKPAYIHAFSMTDNYLVLIECPFVVNPLSLMFSGKPFIENYKWQPENGTNFYIVEKDSGKFIKAHTEQPFFTFHPVNAFEQDNKIVIDIPIYQSSEIINDFYLDKLKANKAIHDSVLNRYTIDLTSGKVNISNITDKFIELPRINYKKYNGKNYSCFYSNSISKKGKFLDQLIKFNIKTGENSIWSEEGCYPSEPVFIEKSGITSEDQGVVLSTVFDSKKAHSFLLVLDAQTFSEMARVQIPHHIPFGFHGQFVAKH